MVSWDINRPGDCFLIVVVLGGWELKPKNTMSVRMMMNKILKIFIFSTAVLLSLSNTVPTIAQQWEEREGHSEFQRMKSEIAQLHERIEADKDRVEEANSRLRADQEQMEGLRRQMEDMRQNFREENQERREEGRRQ
jgi:septal ring factor EnvC (AmiA/AmiB activator)